MSSHKVRIRFAKRGDLRLISHNDLVRCLERALRRAGLPVAVSQGFTPRPKVSFAQALALGVEGRREVLEIELKEPVDASEVGRLLGSALPDGFDLIETAAALGVGRAARAVAADYHLPIPERERPAIAAALVEFTAASTWHAVRTRGDRQTKVDIRPLVAYARLDESEDILRFRLVIDQSGSLRPVEWFEALGLGRLLTAGAFLVRDDIVLADEASGSEEARMTFRPAVPSSERTNGAGPILPLSRVPDRRG